MGSFNGFCYLRHMMSDSEICTACICMKDYADRLLQNNTSNNLPEALKLIQIYPIHTQCFSRSKEKKKDVQEGMTE